MKLLVVGWFSYEHMGNSAGDMSSKNTVCSWLKSINISYDVAVAEIFNEKNSVKLDKCDPDDYTDLLFICGPLGFGWPITELLGKFQKCRFHAINVSLLQSLEVWNPFTLLYERDSSRLSNPDLAFLGASKKKPVVGIILISKQDEYGDRDHRKIVNAEIKKFARKSDISAIEIDTVLENNLNKLKTSDQIESLISKMDVVITSRLHGTVLALKNGIPVIAVDPVKNSAKVSRQVKAIGWPILLNSENVNMKTLSEAFKWCCTKEAKLAAINCTKQSIDRLELVKQNFIADFNELRKISIK